MQRKWFCFSFALVDIFDKIMRVELPAEGQIYEMFNEKFNPPIVRDQREENLFQAEIRSVYSNLIEKLSHFGSEGDFYGISDFSVSPDLQDRPSVIAPPSSHNRQFSITILTRDFFESDFISELSDFLKAEPTAYRICLDQDFEPDWVFRVFMTSEVAHLYCTDSKERAKLISVFSQL